MPDGLIDGQSYQAPHCDDKVLHSPGKCKYCDAFPEAQQTRIRNNVNFTGEGNPNKQQCPAEARRPITTIHRWSGNQPADAAFESQQAKYYEELAKALADYDSEGSGTLEIDPEVKLPPPVPTCICVAGRSRFCPVHGEEG